MRTVYRKQCPRCKKDHSSKGFRYCDPCEREVIQEMHATHYLEDRHMRTQLPTEAQRKVARGVKP